MKLKSLLMSGLIMLIAGFVMVGCNENPGTEPGTDDVVAPTGLMASSLDGGVKLSWTASTTPAVTYRVTYVGGSDSNSMNVTSGTTASVTGLTNGTVYTFSVVAIDADDNMSTAATLNWAPANRYVNAAGSTTAQINLYEKDSPNPSGFTLDPAKGGPKPISVSAAGGNDVSKVQLAFYLEAAKSTFKIGPARGVSEYQNTADFDQTVVVSDSAYAVSSLDDWMLTKSLDNYFTTNRSTPYNDFNTARTDGKGYAFMVRTGTSGNYHYARVFVTPGANSLILGTAPNRFVTLEVSYQTAVGVAYAKH